jgi:hypothetical protein
MRRVRDNAPYLEPAAARGVAAPFPLALVIGSEVEPVVPNRSVRAPADHANQRGRPGHR